MSATFREWLLFSKATSIYGHQSKQELSWPLAIHDISISKKTIRYARCNNGNLTEHSHSWHENQLPHRAAVLWTEYYPMVVRNSCNSPFVDNSQDDGVTLIASRISVSSSTCTHLHQSESSDLSPFGDTLQTRWVSPHQNHFHTCKRRWAFHHIRYTMGVIPVCKWIMRFEQRRFEMPLDGG